MISDFKLEIKAWMNSYTFVSFEEISDLLMKKKDVMETVMRDLESEFIKKSKFLENRASKLAAIFHRFYTNWQ